jgi:hypothetical protein
MGAADEVSPVVSTPCRREGLLVLTTLQQQTEYPVEKVTREITGNEAYQAALLQEPPNPRSGISFYLYACCILGFFCSTMNGYDGSLFNSLMENKNFLAAYHGSNSVSQHDLLRIFTSKFLSNSRS